MRGLIIGIAGLLLLASPAFCQVDTLQLVEIGSIEAPSDITNLYVEDLDADDLKEIILTTATNIHIYNGITYEEIWTSPELDNPEDLLFEDINLDGFIDFSVKDTTNIYLLDSHNDATIWISPAIDSTYSCYTIGDRNDDEWIDVAIVNQIPVYYESDYDTAWVTIFNGPAYIEQMAFSLPLLNFYRSYPYPWYWHFHVEIPIKIEIKHIFGADGLRPIIALFSRIYDEYHPLLGIWEILTTGDIFVFDGIELVSLNQITIGKLAYDAIIVVEGERFLYTITSREYLYDPYYEFWARVNILSTDSLIASDTLFICNNCMWKGFVIEDINHVHPGKEICYGSSDSLRLVSSIILEPIWETGGVTDLESITGILVAESLFDNPQIICQIGDPLIKYQFFDGSGGTLSGVLPAFGYPISEVDDLDHNVNDEILSIAENVLFIYGLQRTGIEDETILPERRLLLSNFPNPFNSTTTIEYSLPEAGHVNIEIYDLLGRKVATPVDEEQEAGAYQVVWDAGDRSSGVYFYKITAGDFAETRRMVLLK